MRMLPSCVAVAVLLLLGAAVLAQSALAGGSAYVGVRVYVQAASLDPTADVFGAIASNAAELTIGNQ